VARLSNRFDDIDQEVTVTPEMLDEFESLSESLDLDRSIHEIIPNAKQIAFICSLAFEVMLSGLNQGGKSTALLLDIVIHSTGLYDLFPWYKGPRYPDGLKGLNFMLGGETAETTRDLLCDKLLGRMGERGSGLIPSWCIDEKDIILKTGGVRGQVDYFSIQHFDSNGHPDFKTWFKVFAYSKGWERAQGYTIHRVYIDEEPPFEVYTELSARLNATQGVMKISETPLKGYTELYQHFKECKDRRQRDIIVYTVDDADHQTEEWKQSIRDKYRGSHMERTRAYGEPTYGSGIIFPFDMEEVTIPPRQVPDTWKTIIGMDFPHTTNGVFGAVKLAISPDKDEVWIVSEYKNTDLKGESIPTHSAQHGHAVKKMGGDKTKCAWPHDAGRAHDGQKLKDIYAGYGLDMCHEAAYALRPKTGGGYQKTNSVDYIIQGIFDLLSDRKLKIFDTCEKILREFRTYRAEGDKPVKGQDDHLMDALFKGWMMMRFAKSPGEGFSYAPTSNEYEVF